MRQNILSDGEWKLMNVIWEKAPVTLGELVAALNEENGWSKSVIYMMLKRMVEKKVISMDSQGKDQRYSPILERSEAEIQETENFLDKVYQGSVRMMLSSMTGQKKLSGKEIEELYEFLKKEKERQEE